MNAERRPWCRWWSDFRDGRHRRFEIFYRIQVDEVLLSLAPKGKKRDDRVGNEPHEESIDEFDRLKDLSAE